MSKEIIFPKTSALELPGEMIEKLEAAANLIKGTSLPVRIISHYDADGLTAAAVLSAALIRMNKRFQTSLMHGLEPKSKLFTELKDYPENLKIFSDMGSGQLGEIEKLDGWCVILDHHKPQRDSDANNVLHINAHLFGYNGSVEVCAATLAFLLALQISPQNWDLIHIALAGAIGDKQNKNGFQSINLKLLETAKELEIVKESIVFKHHGSSIGDALVRSTDPYIDVLSNNENPERT